MEKTLKIRDTVLGEGKPKIIVPIVDITKDEILYHAQSFEAHDIDIVEWRADYFNGVDDHEAVRDVLMNLREILSKRLLLFTLRTSQEGGEKNITPSDYLALNRFVAESGYADLVDVEIFRDNAQENIDAIHALGVKVVGSNHDFNKTPPFDELISRLKKMQNMGADIPKLAVMAKSPGDVLTLLCATYKMHTKYADRPILTISMRGVGSISRMCGEIFGSCASFGTIGHGSAPGQISVEDLRKVLEVIHVSNDRI